MLTAFVVSVYVTLFSPTLPMLAVTPAASTRVARNPLLTLIVIP
jgi:hypothetical protein